MFLIDISLPDMDGYQLVGQLKRTAKASSPRFFAVTGYTVDELGNKPEAAGFDGHFVKPIDLRKLNQALLELRR